MSPLRLGKNLRDDFCHLVKPDGSHEPTGGRVSRGVQPLGLRLFACKKWSKSTTVLTVVGFGGIIEPAGGKNDEFCDHEDGEN